MTEIRKILYPTDFSRLSARALPHVVGIAGKHGAEVTMLHVLTPTSEPSEHLAHHLQWMLETGPGLADAHLKVTAAVVKAKTADAGILDHSGWRSGPYHYGHARAFRSDPLFPGKRSRAGSPTRVLPSDDGRAKNPKEDPSP